MIWHLRFPEEYGLQLLVDFNIWWVLPCHLFLFQMFSFVLFREHRKTGMLACTHEKTCHNGVYFTQKWKPFDEVKVILNGDKTWMITLASLIWSKMLYILFKHKYRSHARMTLLTYYAHILAFIDILLLLYI